MFGSVGSGTAIRVLATASVLPVAERTCRRGRPLERLGPRKRRLVLDVAHHVVRDLVVRRDVIDLRDREQGLRDSDSARLSLMATPASLATSTRSAFVGSIQTSWLSPPGGAESAGLRRRGRRAHRLPRARPRPNAAATPGLEHVRAAVERHRERHRREVQQVLVVGRHGHARVVRRALVRQVRLVDELPVAAAIVRAIQPRRRRILDERVHAVRIAWRYCHRDLAQRVVRRREAVAGDARPRGCRRRG